MIIASKRYAFYIEKYYYTIISYYCCCCYYLLLLLLGVLLLCTRPFWPEDRAHSTSARSLLYLLSAVNTIPRARGIIRVHLFRHTEHRCYTPRSAAAAAVVRGRASGRVLQTKPCPGRPSGAATAARSCYPTPPRQLLLRPPILPPAASWPPHVARRGHRHRHRAPPNNIIM